jgi:hypothetical protein
MWLTRLTSNLMMMKVCLLAYIFLHNRTEISFVYKPIIFCLNLKKIFVRSINLDIHIIIIKTLFIPEMISWAAKLKLSIYFDIIFLYKSYPFLPAICMRKPSKSINTMSILENIIISPGKNCNEANVLGVF